MQEWRAEATASSMERTAHCPAWVMLARDLPPESDKPYATEGTDLHLDVRRALECETPLDAIPDPDVAFCVKETRDTIPTGSETFYEKRLPFCGTSGGIDVYAVHAATRQAYLIDFKFGMGIRVVAKDNEQIAAYMVAIRDAHPKVKRIHAKIVQPRISGEFEDTRSVTDWSLSFQSIAAWKRSIDRWLTEVEEGERMAIGPGCRFCPVRPVCPLYVGQGADVIAQSELLAITESNLPINIPKLAQMLQKEEQVLSWFKKLREFLEVVALQGIPVPGFELRRKVAHRIWHEMMEEEEIMAALIEAGVSANEVRTKPKLISPAQAEKLATGDISLLWQKPVGALALRPIDSDKGRGKSKSLTKLNDMN